ncbi:Transportin-PC [Gaertneriomyces semiglobifer]|nr:Transportin-PC [Gaertneriomyces semiglobifer]
MAWQPSAENLQNLIALLKNSTSSDNVVQTNVRQQLESFNGVPEYSNYLACILVATDQEPSTRAIAGLTLKNQIRIHVANLRPENIEHIKHCIIQGITDPQPAVRAAAGSVVTTIVSHDLSKWPEALEVLMRLIDSAESHVVEGAFGALQKICEDSARQLEDQQAQMLSFMIQKFIQHFENPNFKVRAAAIQCVNQFILMHAQGLMVNMEAFVQGLYKRANDEEPDVRKNVCQAMVMLLEAYPEALIPQLDNVVNFMLFCTDSNDENVALEACEFWLSFAEQDSLRDHLEPYLPRIVPVLLKGMVYSEEDIIILGAEAEDAHIADQDQDIKPRHHKAKTHALDHEESAASATRPSGDDDEDEEDDMEDDEDEDDVYTEWNLRKCSAAALDVLATVFENDLLSHLLPYLQQELYHKDWEHRECGILALGAVADGCLPGMMQHLNTLIPYLIHCFQDPQPLVRSITCWTLGRYARWTLGFPAWWQRENLPTEEHVRHHRETYFRPLILGLCNAVLDNNKRVQEAACSALATVEEDASSELLPYLDAILNALASAFRKYQHKNLLILYDAVGTLADAVGSALAQPMYANAIMTPLLEKWGNIGDDDRAIFPLFECMSSVATALGPAFSPMAGEVWARCLKIISNTYNALQVVAQHQPDLEAPDKDFIVVSLDLLSGVAQGMGPSIEPVILGVQPSAMMILPHCMKDASHEVRQSAYALLGDLAISAFPTLKPQLAHILPDLISQIDTVIDSLRVSVINNAVWAAGEIALKMDSEMERWVSPILERLITLLVNPQTPKPITENAAITIGRLGYVCPHTVSPHLDKFMYAWCESLRGVKDNLEKESAFKGLCRMIEVNPNGAMNNFVYFCDAVTKWQRTSPELAQEFNKILRLFKTGWGPERWAQVLASYPGDVQTCLRERYGL